MRTKSTFLSVFFFVLFSVAAFGQMPQKRNHEVPLDSAKKFIKNLEKDAMQLKTKGGMFDRSAFEKILGQKGCTGIRYYYAKTDEGTPTIVLVGVDSSGSDMITNAMAMERSLPCPPFCDTQNLLLK